MALETLLIKAKKTISNTLKPPVTKKPIVGVLAFEIGGLMSKLLHLWQSLSDNNISLLRNESICLEGVRKIVSNDEAFLLSLACAEITENLRLVAKSVSMLSKRCDDPNLRRFDHVLNEFEIAGIEFPDWVLSMKEMEAKNKKMDRYVTTTATLHRNMDELLLLESTLSKLQEKPESSKKQKKIIDVQQNIVLQRQEVKYMKERSLWIKNFDGVTLLLVKSIFTILQRVKLVFGIGHGYTSCLPRSLSASAVVYPDQNHDLSNMVSEPVDKITTHNGFFELNSKILKPPTSTLGGAALSLHYANLIIVLEKLIKSPQLLSVDARDDVYSMLPSSIRSMLRDRLRGVEFSASDPVLAREWNNAMGQILGWLSQLAHNMIKWQSERSFEHQHLMPKTNVLLLQTLYFANQEKTEAAITELLVGLNYIWRFEREMNAKALFEYTYCNGFSSLKGSS